jgi:hypothetical protein
MQYFSPIAEAGRAERAYRAQAFTNFIACVMDAKPPGDWLHGAKKFEAKFPKAAQLDLVRKSTVGFGTTLDSTFAAPLAPIQQFAAGFIDYLRPLTILGKMQGLRSMPFNTQVGRAATGAVVSWTGQGVAAVATTMSSDSITMKIAKVSGLIVLTKEVVKLGSPSAQQVVRDDLAAAVAQFIDQQFLDPSVAEVTDISPASITNGAPVVASTGATLSAISTDLAALLAQITTNFANVYLIMRPSTALGLSKLSSGSGGAAFPNLGAYGGSIWGIPVLTTTNAALGTDSPGNHLIIAIDASEIFLADGGIEFDASENALVEMQTSPDSPRTASTILVSLYQENLVAVLVRRVIRWQRRREGSVAVLTGVSF